ncbi:MAG: flagellar biosynthetic protein FliO [Geminicoccaceae bacterium]
MEIVSSDYLRFVMALAVVLGLIAIFAWLAKRFRFGSLSGIATGSGRLEIVESLAIDARQRLMIIRCGNHEHLLLIGSETGQLIEGGIETQPHRLSENDKISLSSGR